MLKAEAGDAAVNSRVLSLPQRLRCEMSASGRCWVRGKRYPLAGDALGLAVHRSVACDITIWVQYRL